MECPACNAPNIDGAQFCASCGAQMPAGPPEEQDALIGEVLGGRYTITKILGEGGMGRVYEAERKLAGVSQKVAVKTLHQHLSNDPTIVARFHRECGTVATLKHPNTIKVEDFGQASDGTLYIAMEFVDGQSVEQALGGGPMEPGRVERIMEQVCGSLAEAHKQGVIHRDLKPDNVVLMDVGDEKDFVKVLDFGIAARKDSTDAAKEQKLTQQGMVLGTPPYMSPEQFTGKELDLRSDIYSLGVMAYEMLAGKLPFEATTPWEWATCHMTSQPHPFEEVTTVSDRIPGKMKSAIFRALSKNRDDRHGSVREFFEDLASGGAKLLTSQQSAHGMGTAATGAMSAFGGSAPVGAPGGVPSDKGGTQLGTPAFTGPMGAPPMTGQAPVHGAPGGQGSYGANPGGAAPQAIPAPPPPGAGQAQASNEGGGGNKVVLIALLAFAGLIVLGAGGMILSHYSHDDGDEKTKGLDGSKAGGDPDHHKVKALDSDHPPPDAPPDDDSKKGDPKSASTTKKPPTKKTGGGATGKKPPPIAGGAEACNQARSQANSLNITGAVALYRRCTGSRKSGTAALIRAKTPTAVRSAGMRGNCAAAKSHARAGRTVGANANVASLTRGKCK